VKRGDIVLIDYPFSNQQGTKVRPALVISSDNYNKKGDDALFILISSTLKNIQKYDVTLEPSNPEFGQTGLKNSSKIRADKIVYLLKSLATRKLGSAGETTQKQVDKLLKDILGLNGV